MEIACNRPERMLYCPHNFEIPFGTVPDVLNLEYDNKVTGIASAIDYFLHDNRLAG